MTARTFNLPHCKSCHCAHWPPREICPHCLGESIAWQPADGGGRVLTTSTLHHSLSPEFRPHLPLQVATVMLDCGVRTIVYLDGASFDVGGRVTIGLGKSPTGQDALVATSTVR